MRAAAAHDAPELVRDFDAAPVDALQVVAPADVANENVAAIVSRSKNVGESMATDIVKFTCLLLDKRAPVAEAAGAGAPAVGRVRPLPT